MMPGEHIHQSSLTKRTSLSNDLNLDLRSKVWTSNTQVHLLPIKIAEQDALGQTESYPVTQQLQQKDLFWGGRRTNGHLKQFNWDPQFEDSQFGTLK